LLQPAILAILLEIQGAIVSSQKRAIRNYRSRLGERGLARFEVLGRDGDRDLIRSLARRLAEDGPEATRLRAALSQSLAGEPPKKGGILAALRRSPLVGADLDLPRPRVEGRKVVRSSFDALSARYQHPQQHHQARAIRLPHDMDGRSGRHRPLHLVADTS
jgi:hypothetical protein